MSGKIAVRPLSEQMGVPEEVLPDDYGWLLLVGRGAAGLPVVERYVAEPHAVACRIAMVAHDPSPRNFILRQVTNTT